ncbi:hypothetical protein [Spiroplasma melliferum]|uniref:Uncharacterized protein n=2 Tax=Spiroplasma melliferum TaxID=2134 RepID=A0AAI9T2X1_SPIME|nr:hypothetical protein [Spiroplasma melliferum]KAI92252.1 hypothetical protein SPM_005875 [Spiroplasma melliferum KC3]QCO23676.1 hypothetical protein SRED_002147 [Spiroplasma melliferum]
MCKLIKCLTLAGFLTGPIVTTTSLPSFNSNQEVFKDFNYDCGLEAIALTYIKEAVSEIESVDGSSLHAGQSYDTAFQLLWVAIEQSKIKAIEKANNIGDKKVREEIITLINSLKDSDAKIIEKTAVLRTGNNEILMDLYLGSAKDTVHIILDSVQLSQDPDTLEYTAYAILVQVLNKGMADGSELRAKQKLEAALPYLWSFIDSNKKDAIEAITNREDIKNIKIKEKLVNLVKELSSENLTIAKTNKTTILIEGFNSIIVTINKLGNVKPETE